jgi:hypothetical protein
VGDEAIAAAKKERQNNFPVISAEPIFINGI